MENAIEVKGLVKSFNKLQVLKGVEFTVGKGNIFALLGSNGAGKTTTIKILTTLMKPDKGTVTLCGLDILTQGDKVRRTISLTGQFTAVDDVLTGRENLRMIGRLRHLPDVRQKTEELLLRFDLTDAADRRAGTYSGGMKRRLDLAMSLMGSPSVIFLDEPTTGLDPQARLMMWKIIRELARGGTTIFLTTQYLEEAERLADRIAILSNGGIVAAGTAAELKKMLPPGHLEIRLQDEKDVPSALELFRDCQAAFDEEEQVLRLEAGEDISQLTGILNRLSDSGIPVAEFARKQPTLEDAFLTIVGHDTGKGGAA